MRIRVTSPDTATWVGDADTFLREQSEVSEFVQRRILGLKEGERIELNFEETSFTVERVANCPGVREFMQEWEGKVPDLLRYTCWKQARRYAKSYQDLHSWLRSERDKLDYVAVGLWEEVKENLLIDTLP